MTTLGATWLEHPAGEIPAEIEGLIFDCDGTLVDTMPTHFVAWTKALEPLGIAFPEERFYDFAGAPTLKIVETLSKEQGVEVHAPAVARQKEQYFIEYLPQVTPIELVVDIARRERGRRKLAVASGGEQAIIRKLLTSAGILDLFDAIVCADDVVHGKPAPEVFLLAATKMGVAPERCAVYEDGEMGFLAARAANMPLIDVRPWYLPRK
jgi:HAD superfamily hydrolase (TIGR01509 family)